MSKDNSEKQKHIDDVLLSIDSLLDTATDIELRPDIDNSHAPAKNLNAADSAKQPKKSITKSSASGTGKTKQPIQKQPARPRKKATPKADSKVKTQAEKTIVSDKENTAQKTPSAASDSLNTLDTEETVSTDEQHIQEGPSSSLSFTTVDDDLTQVMRELPVLDDIISTDDLSLIGSGKEPPKKILTEAFKRKSQTDKIIDILENQLADYNITKLEYKYLHELIDELLEKENKKNN